MEFSHSLVAELPNSVRPSSEDYYPGPQRETFVSDEATLKAKEILNLVMPFRRMAHSHGPCDTFCQACMAPHLPTVVAAVVKGQPLTFVLPAFPGKSPNLAKVLGPLPDMAEQKSLEFLAMLCERINRIYRPGAHVILCSDGRVFSDAVGIKEADISAYQDELSGMIERLSLSSLSTFNLDDVYSGEDFHAMRAELMNKFGRPLAALKELVRLGALAHAPRENAEAHRLYCGITRFLFEDSLFPGQTKTRSALQKDCRGRAYEVIQRSNAWSELIAHRFPNAVRLSIHPQGCGSKKLGIRLLEGESWMTPWHGVAVEVEGRVQLLKRKEAEALGAELVFRDNRPSHYKLGAGLAMVTQ